MNQGIEERARQLCHAESNGVCWEQCGNSCRAVCPSDKHLLQASRQLFDEYWDAHPSAPPRGERRIRVPVPLKAVWRASLESLNSWWRDRRAPRVYGKYVRD